MAKKPSKKQAQELFMEPESDEHFACIVGYTSGGAPYGLTWEEQEEIERRAAAKKKHHSAGTEGTCFSERYCPGDADHFRYSNRLLPA